MVAVQAVPYAKLAQRATKQLSEKAAAAAAAAAHAVRLFEAERTLEDMFADDILVSRHFCLLDLLTAKIFEHCFTEFPSRFQQLVFAEYVFMMRSGM